MDRMILALLAYAPITLACQRVLVSRPCPACHLEYLQVLVSEELAR